MSSIDKREQIYSAVVVAALLVGTASGNAMIILMLSAIALLVGVVFFRSRMNSGAVRVMIVAALTAMIVAIATGYMLR